jgi:hypothetical protein
MHNPLTWCMQVQVTTAYLQLDDIPPPGYGSRGRNLRDLIDSVPGFEWEHGNFLWGYGGGRSILFRSLFCSCSCPCALWHQLAPPHWLEGWDLGLESLFRVKRDSCWFRADTESCKCAQTRIACFWGIIPPLHIPITRLINPDSLGLSFAD